MKYYEIHIMQNNDLTNGYKILLTEKGACTVLEDLEETQMVQIRKLSKIVETRTWGQKDMAGNPVGIEELVEYYYVDDNNAG
jgi:hypothetical protein